MEATISTTTKDRASMNGTMVQTYKSTIKHMTRDSTVKFLTIVINRYCTLDNSSVSARRAAVLPKKVLLPVYSTVPSVSPRTTVDPIKVLSPSYKVTGKDSPVSAAWSTSIWATTRSGCFALFSSWVLTRQSAGMAEPDASSTMSPGTKVVPLMTCHLPSRLTVALGFKEFFRASTASPALTVS